MPSRTNRSARPMTPRPMRRMCWASSVISLSGYWLASMTFSRKWVETWMTRRRRSQSMRRRAGLRPLAALGVTRRISDVLLYEGAEVDGAEVADVVGEEGLLAAGVGRLVAAEVGDRIVVVGLVDEEHARLAGLPRAVDDPLPHRPGLELAGDLAGLGVEQVVGLVLLHRLHERVGDRDRDVEVGDLARVVLAGDEVHDVRVVHPEDAHVGAAAGAALLHHIGRGVEQAHEGDRARGHAHGAPDDVVLGPEPGEAEAGAAAGLVHQGHGAEGVVDAALAVGEGVVHREDEAGGELAQRAAGVHQGGRVGHEAPGRHDVVEVLRRALDLLVGRAVLPVRLRHRTSPPARTGRWVLPPACRRRLSPGTASPVP